jgi:phosphate-selective porin OprO/OprP
VTTGLFSAAIILDRQEWVNQSHTSQAQVGDLDLFDGGELRAFRLGFIGRLNTRIPIGYTVFAATNAYGRGFNSKETDEISFFDWRLDFPVTANSTIAVGKQKQPISMSRIGTGLAAPVVDERAPVVEAFLPSRSIGALYSYAAPDGRSTFAVGGFNDWLDNGGSISDNANSITGRVSWLPYLSGSEVSLFHLAAGYKNHDGGGGQATLGIEPEFNLAPEFIELDFLDVQNTNTMVLEAAYKTGPLTVIGEYYQAELDSDILQDPSYDGYYVSANWALTGEHRPYNKRSGSFGALPMSRPTSSGGWGTWEVATRYSHLDMDDGAFDAGEMDILSLGLNWWVTDSFTIAMYYRFVDFEQFGVSGSSDGFTTRMIFLLQ